MESVIRALATKYNEKPEEGIGLFAPIFKLPIPHNQHASLTRLVIEYFQSKSPLQHEIAKRLVPNLLETDRFAFAAAISPEVIVSLFADRDTSHVYAAIEASYYLIKAKTDVDPRSATEELSKLNVIISVIISNDAQPTQEILYAAFFLINTFPAAMPRPDIFVRAVVRFLGHLRPQADPLLNAPLTRDDIIANVNRFADIVRQICTSSPEIRGVVLREILVELQTASEVQSLLALILPDTSGDALQQIESYMKITEEQFPQVLMKILGWPQTVAVSQWSLLLIDKYRTMVASSSNAQKIYSWWLDLTAMITPLLSFQLFSPPTRDGALSVLDTLLIGFHQHSPTNFHTCLRPILEAFKLLQAQYKRVTAARDDMMQDSSSSTPAASFVDGSLSVLSVLDIIHFHTLVDQYVSEVSKDKINGPTKIPLPTSILDQAIPLPEPGSESFAKYEENLGFLLSRIAELLYIKMHQHKGFPELYTPVLQSIHEYNPPSDNVLIDRIKRASFLGGFVAGDLSAMEYQFETDSFELAQRSDEMRKEELCGLINMGNTCFANAFLQALFATDKLTNALVSQNPSPSSEILSRLQQLFAAMILTDRYAVAPTDFLSALPDWLRGGQQHDSSEFGRYLLDQIGEAIKKDYPPGVTPPTSVTELFGGKTATYTLCSECNKKSRREEDFVDLGLMFPDEQTRSGSITLQELIKLNTSPEKLTGDNRYRCSNCSDQLRDAEKKVSIAKAPHHLIVTLNRFSFDMASQTRRKILQEVVYPEWLEVPAESDNGTVVEVPYILYAVVMHSGQSAEYGHYYAYARHSDPTASLLSDQAPWHRFNDENVAASSFDSFSSITKHFPSDLAYMLFYVKVQDAVAVQKRSEASISAALVSIIKTDNERFASQRATKSTRTATTSSISASRYVGPADAWRGNDDDMDYDGPPPPSAGHGMGMGGRDIC